MVVIGKHGLLISGGTQPLGLQLARRWTEQARGPVLVLGVEPEDDVPLPGSVAYAQVDLTRTRDVEAVVRREAPRRGLDTIVNLAFHRDPHREEPQLNVEATRTFLRIARDEPGIRHLVHRSTSDVYRHRGNQPDVIREDCPLDHDPTTPRWIRERVEGDALMCAASGTCPGLTVTVLRCAEILAPRMGSQLYDYLSSRVCLRRMGFDPMLNLLSIDDAVRAFELALEHRPEGPVNVPGADTLPLSRAIRLWGRNGLPLPSGLLGPVYYLRHRLRGSTFDYRVNLDRFHYNGVLCGQRARQTMHYRPQTTIAWRARG
ncbi:MAG: NAD-dependent epimerase/dehydratase family protein [Myxococcota bacterium]